MPFLLSLGISLLQVFRQARVSDWLHHSLLWIPGGAHPMQRVSQLESQHPWQTGTLLVWPASGPKETNSGRVRCSEQSPFPAPTRAATYHSHVLSKLPCPKSLQVMGELETSVMCRWVKRKYPSPTVGLGLRLKREPQLVTTLFKAFSFYLHLSASSTFPFSFQLSNPFVPPNEGLKFANPICTYPLPHRQSSKLF